MTTGSSSAEFGNAQSGIISVQTRTGGANYTGNFGYETDEPFGVNRRLRVQPVPGQLRRPDLAATCRSSSPARWKASGRW